MPWAVPTVIAALNWRWVYDEFSGMLNNVLLALGLTQNVVAWLAEPRLAMWCVIAVAVWTGTPFYTMSFLAGLQAIPGELYEAARLDGASTVQEFRYVTVPGMQAIFLVTVMLSTVFTSTSLVVVNILTNGAPAERTNILPNFSFNLAMGTGRLGIASAVNMLFFPLLVARHPRAEPAAPRRARELTRWPRRRARRGSGARGRLPPTPCSRCSSCGPWARSTGW